MKKIVLLSILMIVVCRAPWAQQFGYGVKWRLAVYEYAEDGTLYNTQPEGTQVDAMVTYKNQLMEEIYTETHTGVTDQHSLLHFIIGQGTNPMPPEGLPPAAYENVWKICHKVTVHTPGGPVTIEGMEDVSSYPRANFAYHADNAERINNSTFTKNVVTPSEVVMMQPGVTKSALVHCAAPEGDKIDLLDFTNFIQCDKSISPVSGEEIDVLRIGTGDAKPIVFGAETPDEINHFYTLCALLDDLNHVLTVKALEYDDHNRPRSLPHNTAAIFASNTENPQSAGVLANAQTWGVYGTGQNGTVGISTGTGNGAGTWGSIASAPEAGGFKYALYGNSQGFASSWAAALFGNGFHTGTWTMSSDARLKNEIRGQTNALDKILRLKPSQYTYRQDTPYGLPDGLHYGFLAQDVEQVFPELVSDITMPLSLDPQEMYRSGTTEYKGINYIEMIAILTSAIQEMHHKIEMQSKEIAELHKILQHK